MGRHIYDQHEKFILLNPIDNPKLLTEPGGSVTLPLTSERLIVKAPNQPQPLRARDLNDVFPLLVSLENIVGQLTNAPLNVAVFENLPHMVFSIYTIISMSREGLLLQPNALAHWCQAPGAVRANARH